MFKKFFLNLSRSFSVAPLLYRLLSTLSSIDKSLKSLAESQQMSLKLKLIEKELPFEALSEATYEGGKGEAVYQSEADMTRITDLESAYEKRYKRNPPYIASPDDLARMIDEA